MTRNGRPPGGDSRGPEDDAAGSRTVAVMLATRGDVHSLRRFGRPSSYSLTHGELAAEVRRRRRDGWQSWEVRARFDFGTVTRAA
jgi:hypothetical protein